MSDPKRLLDSDDAWLTELLARGATEAPSAASLEATLSAVGIAGNAIGGAAATKIASAIPAAGKVGASMFVVAAKSAAIGAAAGILVGGGLIQWRVEPSPRLPFIPGHAVSVAPAPAQHNPPAPANTARPVTEEIDARARRRTPVTPRASRQLVATPAPRAQRAQDELSREVAALDQVREALKHGAGERALEHVVEYETRFTGGELRLDALYLRMQAEFRARRLAAARVTAERLLQAGAQGPYASRAREILAERGIDR